MTTTTGTRLAPPLAVIHGAARILAGPEPAADRLRRLCEHLQATLPAEEVRLRAGQRTGDRVDVGTPSSAGEATAVQVDWRADRSALLEVRGSPRPAAELRPTLDTVGALLATVLPTLERTTSEPPDVERRLNRLTVDSLPVGLYVVDRDYRIVLWNRKRETGMQGLRREDVLGRLVTDVLFRQDPERLRAEFDSVFAQGASHESEQTVAAGDLSRTYRTTRLPMRLEGEAITHVITIGEDVTETRAFQRAMHQAEKLAAIGQLAAGVMHEINNPLATIGACAAAIAPRVGPGVEQVVHEYLDIITSEVERCTGIVDRLLDFARSGRTAGDFAPIDVNTLLDRTLFLLTPNARFRRLQVEREWAEGLPAVLGNEAQMHQALMAILLNAADATNGQGRVVVRTLATGGGVAFEIQDDGPGIAPDVLPKIFEPFYTTKGPNRGTGLGLAICYGIIADHHGRVDVRAAPGRGTIFRITLPPAVEEVR